MFFCQMFVLNLIILFPFSCSHFFLSHVHFSYCVPHLQLISPYFLLSAKQNKVTKKNSQHRHAICQSALPALGAAELASLKQSSPSPRSVNVPHDGVPRRMIITFCLLCILWLIMWIFDLLL